MNENYLLKVEHITKNYPGTCALSDVSLEIEKGKVVGFVGENGAGKSTLLKIIMGAEQPSEGEMYANGSKYSPSGPLDANACGIGMVYQEQSMISNLTVGQNIFLGREKMFKKGGIIRWGALYRAAEKVLEAIDITDINVRKKVGDLSFASRQMVEIARALDIIRSSNMEHALLLLDEPTSVLNAEEINRLFDQVRKLREAGHSIVFVSHRLDEIEEICDFVYVFRNGQMVDRLEKEQVNEEVLYERMVGKTSPDEYYQLHLQTEPSSDVVMELKDVSLYGVCKDISFQLHQGEVLGFCGVVGSGKEAICDMICGDEAPTSGTILLNGKEVKFSSPHDALEAGIIMVPEERRTDAIFDSLSIQDNILISNFEPAKAGALLSSDRAKKHTQELIEKLNVKCTSPAESIENLSGGNAQKVVFARILSSGASIIILNHPTRGVDIGAKVEIYSIIRSLISNGASVILIGDTLDECIGLSNRVIIMKDGVITAVTDAPVEQKPSQLDIIRWMM